MTNRYLVKWTNLITDEKEVEVLPLPVILWDMNHLTFRDIYFIAEIIDDDGSLSKNLIKKFQKNA